MESGPSSAPFVDPSLNFASRHLWRLFFTLRVAWRCRCVARHCHTRDAGGMSFQFGRTSILLPRLPHLAQTTRERNHGTSVSAG